MGSWWYQKCCVWGIQAKGGKEMRISKREIVVVGAVGLMGNGGGAPFSTNPQPAMRDRFEPRGRPAVASRSVIEKKRATLDQQSGSGAERKSL